MKKEKNNANNKVQSESNDEKTQEDIALKKKVIELTTQLKNEKQEMESLLFSISHDLRAPLRAIDGYSRILEQDYANIFDEEGLHIVNIIRSSTKQLDSSINDLLLLSRVGRSPLIYDQIDMKNLVNSVFEELILVDERQNILFIVRDLLPVFGVRDLLHQVWINLISNSIKFSLPKDKPEIIITGFTDAEKVTYTIKDNGVGFNPKFKDKLFEPFQRLHKADEFDGTGVGLTIVQRIIHRLGGQVWGDGQPGIGSEFSFTLPKRKEDNE